MKRCQTCLHRRFKERKEAHVCAWWCGKWRKLIGDGSDEALAVAQGCEDWTDNVEEVMR